MINKITKYGLLILISFGFQNCKKEESEPVEKGFEITETMLKTTTFATAKIEPLKNEIKFFGKISADKNKLIEVFPMVGGKVEKDDILETGNCKIKIIEQRSV
jgi:cobalt-zinc-cadmium efflux system membrane fusion protein